MILQKKKLCEVGRGRRKREGFGGNENLNIKFSWWWVKAGELFDH